MKLIPHILISIILLSCQTSPDHSSEIEKEVSVDVKIDPEETAPNEIHEESLSIDSSYSTGLEKGNTPSKISHPKAIGIWKIPDGESSISQIRMNDQDSIESLWIALAWPSLFKYDGTYITGHFFERNGTAIWMSQDDHYKLKTSWHGDSLFYFSPFHRHEFVACFHDTVFLSTEVFMDTLVHTWVYQRITAKELTKDAPILKESAPFDYSLY